MKTIHKFVLSLIAAALLLSICGCTLIGIGVGAVAGSGSTVGMLGGAVIGGVIGHEIGD
jgi:osmotically inducible lipoprotein OsmB